MVIFEYSDLRLALSASFLCGSELSTFSFFHHPRFSELDCTSFFALVDAGCFSRTAPPTLGHVAQGVGAISESRSVHTVARDDGLCIALPEMKVLCVCSLTNSLASVSMHSDVVYIFHTSRYSHTRGIGKVYSILFSIHTKVKQHKTRYNRHQEHCLQSKRSKTSSLVRVGNAFIRSTKLWVCRMKCNRTSIPHIQL